MPRTRKAKESKVLLFIYSLIALTLIIISASRFGIVGAFLDAITVLVFGSGLNLVIYALIALLFLYTMIFRVWPKTKGRIWISLGLFLISTFLFNAIIRSNEPSSLGDWINKIGQIYAKSAPDEGGILSIALYNLFHVLLDRTGTIIATFVVFIIASVLLIDTHQWWPKRDPKKRVEREMTQEEDDKPLFIEPDEPMPRRRAIKETIIPEVATTSAATIHSIGNYTLPNLSLLEEVVQKNKSIANQNAAVVKGKRLIEILNQFDINATLIGTHIGPAVTKFEVKPDSNIKISKISSIQDNIKMELQAKELRIEAPIPGRNAVGVEVPNVEMIPVRMSEMFKDPVIADRTNKKLLVPLGKDLMGKIVYTELDKMPHLLIAGATGSGKSVCINAFITTILLRTSPDEVKLLLIDPKKVEFVAYQQIPHLICPVISDATEAAKMLRVVVSMMENRYEVFSKVGVRNITTYNELLVKQPQDHLEFMPWIVVIIDELADLMIVAGKEVESSIQRITQLARAAGIHLIVATQRPSTDVITGIIKANIPSRIAFAVSSGIDSRTILDHIGAERLLGYGDMLFFPVGEPSSIRIQGVYVSDEEVRRLAEATATQRKPQFDDAFLHVDDPEDEINYKNQTEDPLYEEIKAFVIDTRKASTSTIQRHFGLGYNRAARVMDMLERKGIIGPQQGSKPRDVYGKGNGEDY